MSQKKQTGGMQKLLPIGAPVLGAVIMVAFVAMAFTTGKFDKAAADITAKADLVARTVSDTTGSSTPPGVSPLADTPAAYEPGKRNWPGEITGLGPTLEFPLYFRVSTESPEGPVATEFDTLDANFDKRLSLNEFLKKAGATQDEFLKRDTDPKDNYLSRAEFEKSLGGDQPVLPTEFEIAPPVGVKAVLDYANPAVTLTWERPTMVPAPNNVGYVVYRWSAQHFMTRMNRYRDFDFKDWKKAVDEHHQRYLEWLKTNPGKTKKEFAEKNNDPIPVQPPQPQEWEQVTESPISDVTFTDRAFELDCAFIYAVRTVTDEKIKAGVKHDPKVVPGYNASEATTQETRPIYLSNAPTISFDGFAGDYLVTRVARWHRINGQWRMVRVKISTAPQAQIGEKIKAADLKTRDDSGKSTSKYEPQVLSDDGNPNEALLDALGDTDELDFYTAWRFEDKNSPNDPRLTTRDGLVSLLSRGTRDPAPAPVSPSQMVNPVEVRVVTTSPTSCRFRLVRWHKGGKDWYRVEYDQDVKRGETIGIRGKINDLARDKTRCRVFDMSGREANTSSIAQQEISLETGAKFIKLTGRTVDLGDSRTIDVHGAQFAE